MNSNIFTSVVDQAIKAKKASGILRQTPTDQKNSFLLTLATLLEGRVKEILTDNMKDINSAKNITIAMKRRLTLNRDMFEKLQQLKTRWVR